MDDFPQPDAPTNVMKRRSRSASASSATAASRPWKTSASASSKACSPMYGLRCAETGAGPEGGRPERSRERPSEVRDEGGDRRVAVVGCLGRRAGEDLVDDSR